MHQTVQPLMTLFAEKHTNTCPHPQQTQDQEQHSAPQSRSSGSEMTGGTRNTESDDVPYWD